MGRGRSPGEGWGEGGLGALHLAPALRGLGPRYSLPRPLLSGASTPEKGKRRSLEELIPGTSYYEFPRNEVSRSSPDLITPKTPSTSQRGMRKLSAEELLLDTPDLGDLIIPRLSPYAGRPWTEKQLLRSEDTQETGLQMEFPRKEEHILEIFRTEEEGRTEQLHIEKSQREEQLLKILKPEVNIQRQLQDNVLHEKAQESVSVLSEELQKRLNGDVMGNDDVSAAPSMHSPPTCSCCVASKSLDDLDPWAPWAFTQSNNGQRKRKKTRNKGFYRVLLLFTSSLLLLGIGLVYLSQATQAMLHGVPDY